MYIMELSSLRKRLVGDLMQRGYTLRMVPLQGLIHIPDLHKTVSIEDVRIELYQKHQVDDHAELMCYGFCLLTGEKGYWIEELIN